jgi:hypothetical protein
VGGGGDTRVWGDGDVNSHDGHIQRRGGGGGRRRRRGRKQPKLGLGWRRRASNRSMQGK